MIRVLSIALIVSLATSLQGGLTATETDLGVMRRRLTEAILPVGAEADEVVRQAKAHASRMTPEHTWPDIDTGGQARSNWELRPQLDRALVLAKAAAIARRDGEPDRKLTDAAVGTLAYWLKNDFKSPNWWWNEIGVPQLAGECVVHLGADCPAATRDGVVDLMKRSVWTKWTGQNLVWGVGVQILRGLITNEPDLVARAYARMYEEVVVTHKEGIQADYSFHQHGAQFYAGGYGLAFAQDVGRYIAYAWGTGCQPPADVMETFDHYMLDGEAWMTWGPLFDYSALGREIVRPGKAAVSRDWAGGPVVPMGAPYGLGRTVWLLSRLSAPRRAAYAAWAERLLGASGAVNTPPLVGHKHFWRSDYTVHRRPDYLFSVKLFSTRLVNTELVNGEGKKSHHLGDGNTFLHRTGHEYRDIFPVWDWQRLPGTTAEQADDLDKLLPKGNGQRGLTTFVGGVSDEQYGASAMHLRRGNLSARKSWFFFDDEVVCLGSSIRCDSDNPVVTAVEQSFSTGSLTKGPSNAWVHHADVGYVFPGSQDVRLSDGPQSGAWSDIGAGSSRRITRNVFTLWVDHGVGPQNGKYAYILLPGRSQQDTVAYAARPAVEVVEQSDAAHVVHSPNLQLTAAVFFQPGAAAGIEVDRACIVLFRGGRLSVCDPAQGTGVIRLKVNGRPVDVELPDGLMAGASVTVDVR